MENSRSQLFCANMLTLWEMDLERWRNISKHSEIIQDCKVGIFGSGPIMVCGRKERMESLDFMVMEATLETFQMMTRS